jgi:hypothetical protein
MVFDFWISFIIGVYSFWMILVAVSCGYWFFDISSRSVVALGSGGKRFGAIHLSVSGNTGSAIGPLLVAIIVAPYESNIIWFVIVGILGIFVLTKLLFGTKPFEFMLLKKNGLTKILSLFEEKKFQ